VLLAVGVRQCFEGGAGHRITIESGGEWLRYLDVPWSGVEPAVKLMLRHEHFSADVLLERAREAVGHLVELSHSNSADSLLEISAAGVSEASALADCVSSGPSAARR
jgi:hypothetical protein